MGLCTSREGNDSSPINEDDMVIGRQLKEEQAREKLTSKLLVLGAGAAGKSTLYKQLKLIYGDGFPDSQRKHYTHTVYNNVIGAIQRLLDQSEDLGHPIAADLHSARDKIFELKNGDIINMDHAELIKKVWKDAGIQQTYQQRNKYQMEEAAEYMFARLDAIGDPNYIPTISDVLRCRAPTTGIVETLVTIDGSLFKLVDVGGQRSERKKWIHCFEGVHAVLFVCAISSYDEVLYEDDKTNRVAESLALFRDIVNADFFKDSAIILLLNKMDLFQEKIGRSMIKDHFEDFQGNNTYEEGIEFFQKKFLEANLNPHKVIPVHRISATDNEQVQAAFDKISDTVLKSNMSAQMMDLM